MADSPVFSHPHYTLLDDDRIVRKASAPPKTMSEEGEVLNEIARYVHAKMVSEYGFEQIMIPDDETEVSTSILVTSDWLVNSKLLIIVQNAVGSYMGIFSRTLCLDEGLSKGSMLLYIQRARKAGYSVMVLRPNTNSVMVAGEGGASSKVLIAGSESPEVHALFVWENIVSKADNIQQIALLSYGNGAALCKDMFLRQMVRTKEDETEINRVVAFVAIEASHIIEEDDAEDIKKALKSISVNMEASPSPRGYRLAYRKVGITTISLGMPAGAEGTLRNVATSIYSAVDPVFRFLDMGFMNRRNLAVSFAAAMASEEGHDPTTAETKVNPRAAEEDDIVAAAVPDNEANGESQQKVGIFSRLLGRMGGDKNNANKGKAASGGDKGASEVEEKLTVYDFDLLKVVGKGAFGKVMLVRKKANYGAGQIYAMKVLKKSVIAAKGQIEHTKSERSILCEIRHPFIVRLRFAFQSDDKLYLVTDYYNGGSLFYHLRKARSFTEERAKFYSAELLSALDHLHQQHIIYRDLKLENVLMDNHGHIALTDFGLSKQHIDATGGATTFCGTAEYIAPELLKGQKYGAAVDWWSFGILLYEMMHGRTPFYDKNRKVYKCMLGICCHVL